MTQELDWRDYHRPEEYSQDATQIDEITDLMDEKEVALFLKDKGIPQSYCDVFADNFIDGREFLSLTVEEVKSLVPPVGLAKKIIRCLPSSRIQSSTLTTTPVLIGNQPMTTAVTESPSDVLNDSSGSSTGTTQEPTSPSHTSPSTSLPSTTMTYADISSVLIPQNWRPEVMRSIKTKQWTDSSRNEVVRCLGNMLFSVSPKPSRMHCTEMAKKLVMKYPSTRDELGNGYQSWSDKLVERIRNVIKRDRLKCGHDDDDDQSPVAKRPKKQTALLSRYPVSTASNNSTEVTEDAESLSGHIESIKKEMEKERPRDSLLAQLMRSTYRYRRDQIITESIPVSKVLEDFPALKRSAMIEQEMCLIMNKTRVREKFIHQWVEVYVSAIVEYGTSSNKKGLRTLMKDLIIDKEDDVMMQVTALKVLATVLGKGDKSLIYFYKEHNQTVAVAAACQHHPVRNQPWIAAFLGDGVPEYVIVLERKNYAKVSSLETAIYLTFSLYYCLNLEYPMEAKWMFSFFQDFILEEPDKGHKSASYLTVTSDIKHNILS